jgi:predicted nucleic acid-binding protein
VTPLFVDTSAFYALAHPKERNHGAAKRFLRLAARKKRALVTSTDVFDEAVTLVRLRFGHAIALELGDRVLHSRWCRMIEVEDRLRGAAWEIFSRFDDQQFSFTDCTSFAIMRSMSIDEAFTFDRRDFAAAGFAVVP